MLPKNETWNLSDAATRSSESNWAITGRITCRMKMWPLKCAALAETGRNFMRRELSFYHSLGIGRNSIKGREKKFEQSLISRKGFGARNQFIQTRRTSAIAMSLVSDILQLHSFWGSIVRSQSEERGKGSYKLHEARLRFQKRNPMVICDWLRLIKTLEA